MTNGYVRLLAASSQITPGAVFISRNCGYNKT